jgi:hypothetical protein
MEQEPRLKVTIPEFVDEALLAQIFQEKNNLVS